MIPGPAFSLSRRRNDTRAAADPCPRCPKPSAPDAAAVIARLGAFLALPRDGKWAGNSPSSDRTRVSQNPNADFGVQLAFDRRAFHH
ncbi:MAG: hypothetical protein DLM68_08485 [Hyphomicrobiales bacterium]|nr:MAG: hypothetical protein DLM68_08485 [Hyphomicrobiales bacterium]